MDNGPEFISTTLATWAEEHDVQLEFIQSGKTIQNSYIERFNRTYRTEILDMYVFRTLTEVRELTEDWIREYNEERSHGALNDLIPWEYLMKIRWCWLVASEKLVYEKILCSRSMHSAKTVLGEHYSGFVVSDQCPSYNSITPEKHQLCRSHVTRKLQQISDYSGGGYTAYVGRRLTLIANMIFRIRHRLQKMKSRTVNTFDECIDCKNPSMTGLKKAVY